ncbi:hypothetical protein ET495_06650 [Xylanimonas allomyrinae]|uniref:Uncharacterized protein n=1 Tax=Xylanimonas allomyrinae TaxID=2509459 RepID=A0A4P6EKN8_9MICO|nr:hypothetical protein [Xylanimonas allomyrinae]QAY62975.1 hypothetical protein ET495_06650 [Xylanimonas allomyrinae]
MSTPSGTAVPRSTARSIAIGLLVALVITALAGFWLGRSTGSRVRWTAGTATAVEGQASIETGDFTYGIVGSVPNWIDDTGNAHQSTYPGCLTPGEHVNVRFAWVPANDPEMVSSRVVVAVDCRR